MTPLECSCARDPDGWCTYTAIQPPTPVPEPRYLQTWDRGRQTVDDWPIYSEKVVEDALLPVPDYANASFVLLVVCVVLALILCVRRV